MILDDTQTGALARYLATLRPGQTSWTPKAIYHALVEAREKVCDDPRKLTAAAVNAALDPTVKTPAVIPLTGRHWEGISLVMSAPAGGTATRCRCGGVHVPSAPCQPREDQIAHLDEGELHRRYLAALAATPKPQEVPA